MTDEKESTFLVTHVESDSAVLKDVHDGQVHTLSSNPGLTVDDALEATVAPDPPMEVTYQIVEIMEQRALDSGKRRAPDGPRARARDRDGDRRARPRGTRGRRRDPRVDAARRRHRGRGFGRVIDDDREATLSRAARLGVNRVEVRSEPGVVSVRYMP